MKGLAGFAIFMIAIIIGSMPILFSGSRGFKSALVYCNAVTTGLFLSIGLTHFLPDALESYALINPSSNTLIFVICASTALTMQILEQTGKKINSKVKRTWMPYFLMLLLSIHSLLEGFVLGIEVNPKYAFTIVVAILFHKGAEAFSITTNMLANNISKKSAIVSLLLFSLVTPTGIVIGAEMLNTSWIQTDNIIQTYFGAIAAGTFIYMAIENVHYKQNKKSNKIMLVTLAILGFLSMSVISDII